MIEGNSGQFTSEHLVQSDYDMPTSLNCSWLLKFSGGDFVSFHVQSQNFVSGQVGYVLTCLRLKLSEPINN